VNGSFLWQVLKPVLPNSVIYTNLARRKLITFTQNNMQRKDYYLLSLLFLVVLLIFYPVCYAEFAYTDEIVQLWHYRPGSGFNMYGIQGRWLPEIMLSRLYSAIETVQQMSYIRILSLLTWFVCLPIWYTVMKRVTDKEPAYQWLPFFTCLYLITSLPFAVSVQWVTCMELSIGNTAGLLAGAVWYLNIRKEEKLLSIPVKAALLATAIG
jgi:hypothetical protein